MQAVMAIDPQATGMFSIDLKEDRAGRPCITEINIGRFCMITPIFNMVGRHNMAELYIKIASDENVDVLDKERFNDIGSEEIYLVRELDCEPRILTRSEIDQNYTSLS